MKNSDKIKMAEDYGYAATKYMRCLPVAFSKHAGPMLGHAKSLMDENRIMIDKRFDKLLISLRTAVAEEYKLQKSDTRILQDVVLSLRVMHST